MRRAYIKAKQKLNLRSWVANAHFNGETGKKAHKGHNTQIHKGKTKVSASKYTSNGEPKCEQP